MEITTPFIRAIIDFYKKPENRAAFEEWKRQKQAEKSPDAV